MRIAAMNELGLAGVMAVPSQSEADSSPIIVSFVVSIFNKAPFIPGMIESLRHNLDAGPSEFIFVDDGSSDESVQLIIEGTQDLPNVMIIRQANRGPAVATNVAIAQARGRYLKLLDADDRLVPGIVALMVRELDASGADLLKGEIMSHHSGEELPCAAATLGVVAELIDPLHTVIASGLGNTSGSLFQRESAIRAGGCDESVFIQDFSLFLSIARHHRISVASGIVAYVPDQAPGRISNMQGQALHDMNRALYNVVMADPSLSKACKRLAMRRSAGRTWKWARRHRGATLLSREFLIHAISRLPIAALAPWILRNACRPFRAHSGLRFPGPAV